MRQEELYRVLFCLKSLLSKRHSCLALIIIKLFTSSGFTPYPLRKNNWLSSLGMHVLCGKLGLVDAIQNLPVPNQLDQRNIRHDYSLGEKLRTTKYWVRSRSNDLNSHRTSLKWPSLTKRQLIVTLSVSATSKTYSCCVYKLQSLKLSV